MSFRGTSLLRASLFGASLFGMSAAIWPAAATSCPLGELDRLAGMALDGLTRVELEEQVSRSTEGAAWDVYLTPDGRLHSLSTTIYNHGSQRQERISFLNKREFVIVSRAQEYNKSIVDQDRAHIALEIVLDETERYYFCGGDVYVPHAVDPGDPRLTPPVPGHRWPITKRDPLANAREVRTLFLTAPETATYIAQLAD